MAIPRLLFVVGASGAGKTAAVHALAARPLPGVVCYHFDSIGVPSPVVMERDWGGGDRWQEQTTKSWIERITANAGGAQLAVLEGQTRPSFIRSHLAPAGVRHARIVLLDCAPDIRVSRLEGPRAQPELASQRMLDWALYLRGQADALGLPVLDTSHLSVEAVADALQQEIELLRGTSEAGA
jgi:hypothetical protein